MSYGAYREDVGYLPTTSISEDPDDVLRWVCKKYPSYEQRKMFKLAKVDISIKLKVIGDLV